MEHSGLFADSKYHAISESDDPLTSVMQTPDFWIESDLRLPCADNGDIANTHLDKRQGLNGENSATSHRPTGGGIKDETHKNISSSFFVHGLSQDQLADICLYKGPWLWHPDRVLLHSPSSRQLLILFQLSNAVRAGGGETIASETQSERRSGRCHRQHRRPPHHPRRGLHPLLYPPRPRPGQRRRPA